MHCFEHLLSLGGLQGRLQGHDGCVMCCAVGVKVSSACFYQRHLWKLLGTNNDTCQKVYTLWTRTQFLSTCFLQLHAHVGGRLQASPLGEALG